jgi:spore maturation protein CgeB
VRLLIVDTCYPAFLRSHYNRKPSLRRSPYATQWRALMDTFFGTADAYSYYLGQLGHAAHEVVVNCEPLQKAWAREHGVRVGTFGGIRRRARLDDIVAAQVEDFGPDVLYVQNLSVLDADLLRRLGAGRLVVGQIASELPSERQLRAFDLILTSFPHYVERLRALGVSSEYFRIGFDPRILERIRPQPRDLDIAFIGSLGRSQHGAGNTIIERAAARLPLEVWGSGVAEWPRSSPLWSRYRGEAWGTEMFALLARAKVVLNRHIDVAEDYANNMRLYEATGMGALLLTDAKRNLGELFEPEREVLAYRDEDELIEQTVYCLEHEDEREKVAAAGHARTMSEHTYAHRMQELLSILARYPA